MNKVDHTLLIVRCASRIREAFLESFRVGEREPVVVLRSPSAEVEGLTYRRWRGAFGERGPRDEAEAIHLAAEERGEIHVLVIETATRSMEHVLIDREPPEDDEEDDRLSDEELREARERRSSFIRSRAALVRLLEPRVCCPRGCGTLMRPVQYEAEAPVAQILCAERCPRCLEEIRICRPPLLQLGRDGLEAFLPPRLVEKVVAEAKRMHRF